MGALVHLDQERSQPARVGELERVSECLIHARRFASDHAGRCCRLERALVEGIVTKGSRRGLPRTRRGRLALVMALRKAAQAWARAFDRREALTLEFARLRELVPRELWGERSAYATADPWLEMNIREARAERDRERTLRREA